MRLDKFSLISMEMIDYQLKDPVLDQLHAIIEEYKKDKDGKSFSNKLEEIIKKRFNITLDCNVKEASYINASAMVQLLDIYHPLNKGLLDVFGKSANYFLGDQIVKPNFKKMVQGKIDNIGSLDFKAVKASGIFSQLEYKIELLTPLFERDSNFIISVILHELGHIWTFMEYVHHITFKNVIVTNIVKEFLKIKEDTLRVEFIGKVNNIYGINVPEALAKQSDPKAQLVVVGDIYKQMYNDFSETTYNTTSVEVLADQFASRFGLGIEIIKSMSGKEFSWEALHKNALIGFITSLITLTLTSLAGFLVAIGSVAFSVEMLFCILFAGASGLIRLLDTLTFGQFKVGASNYDTPKQRLVRVRNMMINQLKNNPKNNDAKKLIEQIDESMAYIEKADEFNGFMVKLCRWVSTDFRTQEERKIYNQLLEDLMDNTLYVSGNKFKHLLDK